MKRERQLQRRLDTLSTLDEAVSAMKALSAHHFRLSRQALPAARDYRAQVERALAECGIQQTIDFSAPPGLLLVVSDLGLCGDYNSRLVHAAVAEIDPEKGAPLYCVGKRPRALLERHHLNPSRHYSAPASVDGLPQMLMRLAEDLLDDFQRHRMGSLYVMSARLEGAGHFSPVLTRVLPVQPPRPAPPVRPTNYQSTRHLAAVAVREFLYTTLHELLLDALAAEHGMRLIAAEAAHSWLEETAATVHRQLSAARREATTQELLDLVAGSRSHSKHEDS